MSAPDLDVCSTCYTCLILPLLYLLHLFFTSFVFIAIETFRRESKLTRNTLHSENGLEAGSESQWIPPRLPRLLPLWPDWGSAQANAQSKKEAPRSMHWEPSHASDVPTCATMLHKSQLNTWTQMLLHCLFRILHILYILSTFQILPGRLEGTLVTSFAIWHVLHHVFMIVHVSFNAGLHVTYTYVHYRLTESSSRAKQLRPWNKRTGRSTSAAAENRKKTIWKGGKFSWKTRKCSRLHKTTTSDDNFMSQLIISCHPVILSLQTLQRRHVISSSPLVTSRPRIAQELHDAVISDANDLEEAFFKSHVRLQGSKAPTKCIRYSQSPWNTPGYNTTCNHWVQWGGWKEQLDQFTKKTFQIFLKSWFLLLPSEGASCVSRTAPNLSLWRWHWWCGRCS